MQRASRSNAAGLGRLGSGDNSNERGMAVKNRLEMVASDLISEQQ